MTQTPIVNISRASDSYKFTHHVQYPPGTSHVYSYLEARKAATFGGGYTQTGAVVFFGLQYFLKRYLQGVVVNIQQILESAELSEKHFGKNLYNRDGWLHIVEKHGGRLPVSIRAVPEGTVVPISNVLMTIENTDPECFWLTNWLETLLVQVWSMCTVATHSRYCKQKISDALDTSGDPASLPFKLHDFGFRGVTCPEAAATNGAAHLVNFLGTDTFAAIDMIREYYGEPMAGFSIPASEHSTITSWGRSREVDAYRNMLQQYPDGLVACVSDSYDIFNACYALWGKELKAQVLDRKGTLVVRPDSGDLPRTPVRVIEALGSAFGYARNAKGFKVLPPQVRVIQGDGIDADSIESIIDELIEREWSIDNIAFGSGGGLLQKFTRDTFGFAMKCSSVRINGESQDVYKEPITEPGKNSKRGRLKLLRNVCDGRFATVREEATHGTEIEPMLVEVFRDGEVLVDQSFADVRARAEIE